jgi:hypothetical protein
VLVAGFLAQFLVELLWPGVAFGLEALVLYAVVKWVGDGLVRGGLMPDALGRPLDEWLLWVRLALPAALVQGLLAALGLGVARSLAPLLPCALYLADVAWGRAGQPEDGGDTLGRRLAAWP